MATSLDTSSTGDRSRNASSSAGGRGGWITAPFILATVGGLTLAGAGWFANLVVFLIQQFHIKTIDAAQISNLVAGCGSFFPFVAAILADSFMGCFPVIWISTSVSLLGLVLMVLTVTLPSLRPPSSNCEAAGSSSSSCSSSSTPPSNLQYGALYTALGLGCIGLGGTRFTLGTMGANQFTKPHHQASYFNWYFFVQYFASFTGTTGIVYFEDNVSWAWGFGICLIANVTALVMFLGGSRYYVHDTPPQEEGSSPFTGLLRVLVASFRKRKARISLDTANYYYGSKQKLAVTAPSNTLRSLNRAALKTEGDVITPTGFIANPWNLCTVQQVEDLKSLLKILPLWSSSILLSTPIGVQLSLTTLQALLTDRHVGSSHFQIPAGSMAVFAFLSTAISLSLLDSCLRPLWRKLIGSYPTSLQQVGVGHVLNIASMAVSALVEYKRRAISRSGSHRMSVLWLVPQMAVVGIGEACHFPGQVELYYQEFPRSMKSMSTAMISLLIGVGFYMSTAVVDVVRRATAWLPDDIDEGRVDYVYWMLVVIGVVNFGYFLLCCWFYQYKKSNNNVGDDDDDDDDDQDAL